MTPDEFIDDYLAHAYASKYYDPVKAHEYYMRTRELKGRKSGSDRSVKELTSKAKREAWQVTKSNIDAAKRFETKAAGNQRSAKVAKAREIAIAKRAQITAKLRAANQTISINTSNKRKQIAETRKKKAEAIIKKTDQKIKAVPPVSKSLPKEARAKASAERAEKIAAIRGTAATEKQAVSNEAKKAATDTSLQAKWFKNVGSADAKKEAQRVAFFTKVTVNKAREDWNAQKERIKAKYEAEYDREFESIKGS